MGSKGHSGTDEGTGVSGGLDQKSEFYSSAVKRFGAKEGCGLIYILRNPSNSCAEMDGGGDLLRRTSGIEGSYLREGTRVWQNAWTGMNWAV